MFNAISSFWELISSIQVFVLTNLLWFEQIPAQQLGKNVTDSKVLKHYSLHRFVNIGIFSCK